MRQRKGRGERLNEVPERITLAMGIRIEENDDPGTDGGQSALERACFSSIILPQQTNARIIRRHGFHFDGRLILRASTTPSSKSDRQSLNS
jgi:hypothetical protein